MINYKSIVQFIKDNDDGVRKYTKQDIVDIKQKEMDEFSNKVWNGASVTPVTPVVPIATSVPKVAKEIVPVELSVYQYAPVLLITSLTAICSNLNIPSEHITAIIEILDRYGFTLYHVYPTFDKWDNRTFTFICGKNRYLFDLILEKGDLGFKENYCDYNAPYIRPYVVNLENIYNTTDKSYIRGIHCGIQFYDHPYSYPARLKLQNILAYMEIPNFNDYVISRFGFIQILADKLKAIDESWNVQLIGYPDPKTITPIECFNFNIKGIDCKITLTIDNTDLEIIPSLLYMNGYDKFRSSPEYHLVIRPTYECIMEITDGNISIFEDWYKKSLGEYVQKFDPTMVKCNLDDQTELIDKIHEFINLIRGRYGFLEDGTYYNLDSFMDILDEFTTDDSIYPYYDYNRAYKGDLGKVDMIPKMDYYRLTEGNCDGGMDDFDGTINIMINGVQINMRLKYEKQVDPNNCYLDVSSDKNGLSGPVYQLTGKYTTLETEIKNLITDILVLS
jgi:hypothetical protein